MITGYTMALLMSTLALPWYSSPEKSNILFHYVFFGRSSIFLCHSTSVLGYLYSSCLAFFWVECEDDDNDDDDDARQECCCFLLVTDMVCSSHGGWVNAILVHMFPDSSLESPFYLVTLSMTCVSTMALLMSTLALPWYSSPEKSNILFHYVFFGRSSIFLCHSTSVLGYLYSSCLAFFWVECEDDDNDDDDDARQECCCFLLVTDMVCSSHGGWVNASE
ncbi:hypothetical protein GQR58_022480 [Nymphon striatum]|nr:hypothetical protein GQR58_022480 [Nymphon striatum]